MISNSDAIEIENFIESEDYNKENESPRRGPSLSSQSYPFEALGARMSYTLTKRDPDDVFKGNLIGIKSILYNWLNLLLIFLIFAPLSFFFKWGVIADFILSALALIPLAHLISEVAEDLALHTGDVWGALINASFGNAVELIVSIEALVQGRIKLVQYSLIGSVFSNLLLVLGCALVAGGNNSEFDLTGVSANIILLMIGSLVIATPQMMEEEQSGAKKNALLISRISAIVLFLAYGQLLFWLYQNSKVAEETEKYKLKPWCSALCLAVLTGITTGIGEILVSSIEEASKEIGFTYKFTMLIILPFLGNGVEHYAAVVFAWNKKMDLAINTCVSSSTQICLFLMPLCVLLGWCMDVDMNMGFEDKFVPVMFCLSTIITFAIISDGASHWLEGSMLLTLYFLFGAILCFDETGGES